MFSHIFTKFPEPGNPVYLDRYSGQSLPELLELGSQFRIDSLVLIITDRLMAKSDERPLTASESAIVAVVCFEMEVSNGGLAQFFYNSTNKFAAVLVESLLALNCPKCADIASRAIAVLNLKDLSDLNAIRGRVNCKEADEWFRPLDDEFFANPDGDIAELAWSFIEANRDSISISA